MKLLRTLVAVFACTMLATACDGASVITPPENASLGSGMMGGGGRTDPPADSTTTAGVDSSSVN